MLSRYTAKCKYILKMIQIIAKIDEVFSHILNMNSLYHFNYNWKVWFMWFHKKHLHKFFIQINIRVLKENILLKNYFHLKKYKNCFGGLLYQNPFYIYFKILNVMKEKLLSKYIKILPKQRKWMCFMDLSLLSITLNIWTPTNNISSITTSCNFSYWHVSIFNEFDDKFGKLNKYCWTICSMLNVLLNHQYWKAILLIDAISKTLVFVKSEDMSLWYNHNNICIMTFNVIFLSIPVPLVKINILVY